jgi:hypothetical protein
MVVDSRKLIYPELQSPRSALAVNSYGYLVTRWAKRRLGIEHGPWQEFALERILEHDDVGNLLARTAVISVGRQNGKSVIVRSLIGWLLDEGYRHPTFNDWRFVLLAAHDSRQARIPYDFVRRDLESYVKVGSWGNAARRDGINRIRATAHLGIEINGVKVDVATRQAGSARGHSPGLICFDEVLTQTDFGMYEVLSPALSAVRNSQMLMTSTAGFSDSVVLRSMFDRLYRQSTNAEQHDPSFIGLWWRAESDDVGLDWDALAMANPAIGDGRLSKQSITSEFAILPRGSWVRERLNRWHDERVDAPFSVAQWGMCRVADPLKEPVGKFTIGVDVHAAWGEGTIVVAAMRADGKVGVEVHKYLKARTMPLAAEDFIREIKLLTEKIEVEHIVYPQSSALLPALQKYGLEHSMPIESVPIPKIVQACHDFAEAVMSRRVAHDDPFLDSEIAIAQRRFVGVDGGWRWMITPNAVTSVISSTLAVAYADKATMPVQVFI